MDSIISILMTILFVQSGLYSSRLEEKRKNAGGNISLPFTIAGQKQLFKTGYFWSERKADFDGTGIKPRDVTGSELFDIQNGALPMMK